MRIRRAEARDIPAMSRLKARAGLAAWQHILPDDVLRDLGMPDRWADAVRAPGSRTEMLVSEVDGVVAGFAFIRPSGDADAGPDIGELDGFHTDPDVWGRGAGRVLLSEATAALRSAGFAEATLWTAADNHRPRAIYERAGWRLDGTARRRSLGGVGFTEVRYRLRLG